MKSLLLTLFVGLGLVTTALADTSETKAAVPTRRTTVTYLAPEKFTDFTTSGFGSAAEKDLKYLTELFAAHIETLAQRYLAADLKLEVSFVDIDLAGRFEPEHGPNLQNVRIYRDITYPRMKLTFRLLGPDGQVLSEGERKLVDMSYNLNLLPPTADPEYRHDKALLADWMSSEFKKRKK